MKWRVDNAEAPRRSLRRHRRTCYTESNLKRTVTKRRFKKTRTSRTRRRHRSWSPSKLRRTASLVRFRRRSRPHSASSVDSVVCLGVHKKIPQLIVLDDTSDDEPPRPTKRKLRKLRSSNNLADKDKRKRKSSSVNSSFMNNEADLLNKLREMHVGNLISNGFNRPSVSECQT